MVLSGLTDAALILGTTVRATRLITTDDLGQWLVSDPARRWANRIEGPRSMRLIDNTLGWRSPGEDRLAWHDYADDPDPDNGPRSKMTSGLTCPHCVGYWVGVATLSSYWLAKRRPGTLSAWRALATSLSLSAVVGHLNARIDN